MPELPEVEVTRRGIEQPLLGAQILAVHVGKPLRWPLGRAPQALVGRFVGSAQRRGKYIWLPLFEDGERQLQAGGLLIHLGMSGSLAWWPSLGPFAPSTGKHDHFELHTNRGLLRLTDPRRFGAVQFCQGLDQTPASQCLAKLGAEPLPEHMDVAAFAPTFHQALRKRRSPIKAVLLAGDVVVGAGNIYACEALFDAAIHPALRADRISKARAARLLAAIQRTLVQAVQLGGSSLRDFSDAHGMDGAYQATARVYGREGQPCGACQGPIRRIVQAQRSTFFCPHCQRR